MHPVTLFSAFCVGMRMQVMVCSASGRSCSSWRQRWPTTWPLPPHNIPLHCPCCSFLLDPSLHHPLPAPPSLLLFFFACLCYQSSVLYPQRSALSTAPASHFAARMWSVPGLACASVAARRLRLRLRRLRRRAVSEWVCAAAASAFAFAPTPASACLCPVRASPPPPPPPLSARSHSVPDLIRPHPLPLHLSALHSLLLPEAMSAFHWPAAVVCCDVLCCAVPWCAVVCAVRALSAARACARVVCGVGQAPAGGSGGGGGGSGGGGGGGWFLKPNRLLRLCTGRVTVKTMRTSVHGRPHHAREKVYHRLMQLLAAEHLLHSVGRSVGRW
jgi:hypothetical protein